VVLRAGRLALAGAALICTAAVAGCASSGSSQPAASGSTPAASSSAPTATSSNTPAVVTPSSSAPGTPACATSALQVKLGSSNGYAGGVYVAIDFTNTSGSTCTLFGYPGVSLVTGPPYKQIGLAAKRSISTPKKLVTLAAGATATATAPLQIVDALNFPSANCGPTKATALKIYPPNQTEPVYLPNTSTGCSKPVQIMYIGTVRPAS
jgi:uncharacterized protein DUF4232